MADPLPRRKKGKPKRSESISLKRSEGQDRRVREILEDAKADGLVELEINGVPVSLLKRDVTDAVVKQVLKDIAKEQGNDSPSS